MAPHCYRWCNQSILYLWVSTYGSYMLGFVCLFSFVCLFWEITKILPELLSQFFVICIFLIARAYTIHFGLFHRIHTFLSTTFLRSTKYINAYHQPFAKVFPVILDWLKFSLWYVSSISWVVAHSIWFVALYLMNILAGHEIPSLNFVSLSISEVLFH